MEDQKKQEQCPLCEKTIKACDRTIENLHKHYGYMMETLSPIKKIHLSYADDNDMHFVSSITVRYVHKGITYEKNRRYAPGYTFSKAKLVRVYNEMLEEVISGNHNGEE